MLNITKFYKIFFLIVITLISYVPVYIYTINPIATPGRLVVACLPFLICFFALSKSFLNQILSLIKTYKYFYILVFLYFIFRSISTINSSDTFLSISLILFEFCQVACCSLIGLYVGRKVSNSELTYMSSVTKILFVLVLGYSFIEFAIQDNFLRYFAQGDSRAAVAATVVKFRDSMYRTQSFFEHPLSYAHFITICLPFALQNTNKHYSFVLIAISVLAMLFTGSRLGLLSIFAAVLFSYAKTYNFKGLKPLIYFLSCSFFIVFLVFYIGSQSEAELSSTLTRVKQWQISFIYLKDHFWFGLSPGNSGSLISFSETLNSHNRLWRDTIDSYFLLRFLESGIFAFIALILLVFEFTRLIFYKLSETNYNQIFVKYLLIFSSMFLLFI